MAAPDTGVDRAGTAKGNTRSSSTGQSADRDDHTGAHATENAHGTAGESDAVEEREAGGPGERSNPSASTDSASDDFAAAPPVETETISRPPRTSYWNGTTVTVYGSATFGSSVNRLIAEDLTKAALAQQDDFVAGPGYRELLTKLQDDRCVVLGGPVGIGKVTAALFGLRDAGATRLLRVPADLEPRQFAAEISVGVQQGQATGFIAEGVDTRFLLQLQGTLYAQIRGALASQVGCGLILAVHADQRLDCGSIPYVRLSAPDSGAVIDRLASAEITLGERARKVVAMLTVAPGPATTAAIVRRVRDRPERDVAEIASEFSDGPTHTALDEMFSQGWRPREAASVAAAASLTGSHTYYVEAESERLVDLLLGPRAIQSTGADDRTSSSYGAGTSAALVRHGQKSDVGKANLTVRTTELVAPHRSAVVISHLWAHLGARFCPAYLRWLYDLAWHPDGYVSASAASAAGIVFADDPSVVENELLIPWATHGDFRGRWCAAIALGVPNAIGRDGAYARWRTRTWATSNDPTLRLVAIYAYGTLLGQRDEATAPAPWLWRTGASDLSMRAACDAALAALLGSGAGAERSRSATIHLLWSQDRSPAERRRACHILTLLFARARFGDEAATRSLTQLLSTTQDADGLLLSRLLTRSLLEPGTSAMAANCIGLFLLGVADGQLSWSSLEQCILTMKKHARENHDLPRLGLRLQSICQTHVNRRTRARHVAETVLSTFYN